MIGVGWFYLSWVGLGPLPVSCPAHSPAGTRLPLLALQLMCSVADVPRAMAEILRVLRPGGKYVFLEHVAAQPPARLRGVQHWLSPLSASIADGCHCDRDTLSNIQVRVQGCLRGQQQHWTSGWLPSAAAMQGEPPLSAVGIILGGGCLAACPLTARGLLPRMLQAAGFSQVEAERFDVDVPWPALVFSPHVAGVATK